MDKVTHFEIPADETGRAQQFYKETFGWEINKVPDMPYWMAHTVVCDEQMMPKEAGAINGGLLQRDATNDPSGTLPLIVIQVEDIEASVQKLEANGGKVVLAVRKVGDMGLYARFKDTEGNIMGLWQTLKK